jgi:hypothetical protein
MVVFVEESAEPFVSANAQMRDRGGIGDRLGQRYRGRAFTMSR